MSQPIRQTMRTAVSNIYPNPFQPRLLFEHLDSLASSIAADGLLHKIVVREHPNELGTFQVVDGERRLRAIQELGWDEIDVEVGEFSELQMATLALKSDTEHNSFNVIEIALGYRNLIQHFGKTNVEIAAEYKVSSPVVSNRLRLLALPDSVQNLIVHNELTETHAKTLCSIIDAFDDVQRLAKACADEAWSSRRLEAEVAPVKERLDAAEAAQADGEQPRLLDEPPGEAARKGEPLVSIFSPDDRIEWKSKLTPDVKIYGTVQEVTAKYLVVLPDGMSETIHLDFNVKKLPPLPKAEQVETQDEAAFITEAGESYLKAMPATSTPPAPETDEPASENQPAEVTPEAGIEPGIEAGIEAINEATESRERPKLKDVVKPPAAPAPPSPDIEGASMTATIPAHEADWLDEQDLTAATACALYRRFHQACEGAGVDPETMIAELEGRAASKTEEEAE